MTARVFQRLLALNAAFDEVQRSLAALRRDPFDTAEVERHRQSPRKPGPRPTPISITTTRLLSITSACCRCI